MNKHGHWKNTTEHTLTNCENENKILKSIHFLDTFVYLNL